jgi:hypothetical protein
MSCTVVNWGSERADGSFDSVNFLLFDSVWTLVAVPFLIIAPMLSFAGHVYAVLVVDAVTMIFWFAGFIAVAAWISPSDNCRSTHCRSLTAATVFGAFTW